MVAQMPWLACLCQGWRYNSQPSIGQKLPQASEPTNSGQLASGSTHWTSLRPADRPRKRRSPASEMSRPDHAYNRFEAQRGAPFPSFTKQHIRGGILHFLRDRAGVLRLPRAVEERAMKMVSNLASESCSAGRLSVAIHLFLERLDSGIEG